MCSSCDDDEGSAPGTRPTPLIGDLREFSRDSLGFMARLHQEYGDDSLLGPAGGAPVVLAARHGGGRSA